MKNAETVVDFYKRFPGHLAGGPLAQAGILHSEIGHVNIFRRNTCSTATPYRRRDFYKVSLIIGTGKIYYADKWLKIDRPALLFSNPMLPYSWEAESFEQSGWYCLFTEAFITHNDRVGSLQDSPLFKIGSNPVFFPDEAQIEEISSIFQKMEREIQSNYANKYDIIRSYLSLIIHEALKKDSTAYFNVYSTAFARVSGLFTELLERQFPVDSPTSPLRLKTPADFARSLSVHVNHLNRAVKEVTGKTSSEHISARIIKEARALLMHSDWLISEVAYSLGFEYPSYFTLFFKKHTGSSPNSVRHIHLGL